MVFYWFICEFVHFLCGTVGCFFVPGIVVKAYTLYPNTVTNLQTYEFMHVLASFYLGFCFLTFFSIFNIIVAFNVAYMLFIFYLSLFLQDLYDIFKVGYQSNTVRWTDTSVHVIFGLLNLYFIYTH